MKTSPNSYTQIWIRENETLREGIAKAAKAVGMKQIDYVTRVMQYAVDQHEQDPYFFASRGECNRQHSKRKPR